MMTYILSQFRYRMGRSLSVIIGVALGTALFVALTALGSGFRQAARAPLDGVSADLLITRPARADGNIVPPQRTRGPRLPFGSTPLTGQEVNTIAGAAGVAETARALEFWDFGDTRYQTVLGIDLSEREVGPGHAITLGLKSGRLFQADERGVALADEHYAVFFKLKPGSEISIGGQSFQVVGVVSQAESSQAGVANLYLPLAEAQALVGLPADQVNQVYVRVTNANAVEPLIANLTGQLGDLSIISQESILQVMGGVAQVSARFAQIAGFVGMGGGWFLAWLALSGLVAERQREIGVMKAVGWGRSDVTRAFLIESLLLSLAGGVLGVLIGLGVAFALSYVPAPNVPMQNEIAGLMTAPMQTEAAGLSISVAPSTVMLALLVAIGGGVLAGRLSARRAADLKPARVLYGT